jgi:hypothetical protein
MRYVPKFINYLKIDVGELGIYAIYLISVRLTTLVYIGITDEFNHLQLALSNVVVINGLA